MLTRVFIIVLVPLFLLARLFNAVTGRDRLRLRRPPPGASCWIERGPAQAPMAYFSESSDAEGAPQSSAAVALRESMRLAARLHAPARVGPSVARESAAKAGQAVPDEVYTLW